MLSVSEALILVQERVQSCDRVITLPTSECLGYCLAEDVFSSIEMPPFDQSAMDGYAVRFLTDEKEFKLVGEVKAGDTGEVSLKIGECVRIFTGAKVPQSANAVVMQEVVEKKESTIFINENISLGRHIRKQAEQVEKGELVLEKGTRMTPALIGYLSMLGAESLTLFDKINVSILITGDELVDVGTTLKTGQIYESNSAMTRAALIQSGSVNDVSITRIKDDFQTTKATLKILLKKSDLLLISGGISVGDYDFVRKALLELGVEEVFYKVKQKPGKPLFFGKKENKYVFALPGNPGSVQVCFQIYVLLALRILTGEKNVELVKVSMPITHGYLKKGNRTEFIKGFYNPAGQISLLSHQSSAMLKSFTQANCLAIISNDTNSLNSGDKVEVLFL